MCGRCCSVVRMAQSCLLVVARDQAMKLRLAWLWCWCWLWLVAALPAQEKPPAAPEVLDLTVAALQTRLDAAQADAGLAAELKASLVESLTKALDQLKAVDSLRERQRRYAAQRASAPLRLAERQVELAAIEARRPGPPTASLRLAELEQGLLQAQQSQAEAQSAATEVEREAVRRAERRQAIPSLTSELRARLEALPAAPAEAPELDVRVAAVRRLLVRAERERLQAELDLLAAELPLYDAEIELQRTERDLAARRVTAAKADAEAWLAALQPLRQAEAQRAEREAQQALLEADPRVASLANGNAELAKAAARLVAQRERTEREQAERDAARRRLQQDFDEVRKRAELVGATDAIGGLLRQRRASLAETHRSNQQRTRIRRSSIVDSQLRGLDYDEQRRRLVEDPEAWLAAELGGREAAATLPGFVVEEARRLRDVRRDLLRQLSEGYDALLNTQLDVESSERQFTELLLTYRSYVTERVLGIRSSAPIWRLDLRAAAQASAWIADPLAWQEVWRLSIVGLYLDVWPLLLFLPLVVLLLLRRPLRRRLGQSGDRALRGSNVSYLPTALAVLDTALLAVPPMLLLWLVGWRLAAQPDCSDFGRAMAAGCQQAALATLPVLVLSVLLWPKGLAEAHFRWQSTTVVRLRSAVPLFVVGLLPFAFLMAALELAGEDRWLGSLGGVLLLAELVLLATGMWRVLHPSHGIIGSSLKSTDGPLFRFRRLWFFAGFGLPVVLAVMVALGYEYTALQLTRRVQLTAGVLLGGVLVHALVLRGLLLERRRLQINIARERLEAAKAGEPAPNAAEQTEGDAMDPQSLARQTQALLRGAVVVAVAIVAFEIWVDVLPALGILRRFQVWQGGSEAAPLPVTMADLALSAFILVASAFAARNLPALLELLVLQRLRLEPGERHAISTLARYGIVIVGVVAAFSGIGIGWSKLQWLVAAVSVGLGFGLQEVFANFVSGLILLFEQPIRVGDMVTVGTTTGRVTRIRIRATTIQDWDRKELVVPNRAFVTSSFVNWTLSDSQVRWTIKVGLAYGSDTALALQLLEEVALASRFVLKDPKPEAVFVGFGDSALDVQLRLFVDMNSLEYRWMTELHQAIDSRFRVAGLVIAFPQRDLHLSVAEPVLAALRGGTGNGPGPGS